MGPGRRVSENRKHEKRRLVLKFVLCIISFVFFVFVLLDNGQFAHIRRRSKRGENGDEVVEDNEVVVECENGGICNKDLQSCACTLGWIGTRCNVWHNHYCFFDNGVNYRGKLSITKSGTTCLPWTTDENLRFKLGERGIGVHNYCRNPDNDSKGLWCFVGGEKFVEYCNATRCPDSVKKLLSLNTNEIGPEDDSSAAVQFLFGPLISGVCAGVVALLAFIAIAEYARRKRFFARRQKEKTIKSTSKTLDDAEKGSDVKDKEKTKGGDDEKTAIRTLGGIVTVDVDTGKEKVYTYTSKTMSKARQMLEQSELGEDNNAFIKTEDLRKISAESDGTGPPPPYELVDDVEHLNDNKKTAALDETLQPNADSLQFQETRDIQIKQETSSKRKTGHRKKRVRKTETHRNYSDSSLSVVEDRGIDIDSEKLEIPVPKPRTASKSNDHTHREDEQHKHRKTRRKVRDERDENSRELQRERKTPERHNDEKAANRSQKQRRATKPTNEKSRERHSRRQTDPQAQLDEMPAERKRKKSVKDIAKNFEKGVASNLEYGDDIPSEFQNNELQYAKHNRNEIPYPHSTLNSRMEPTTFL